MTRSRGKLDTCIAVQHIASRGFVTRIKIAFGETATAFDIQGQFAPEPGTLTLMGFALAYLL